jgi:hypothetical protein
MEWLTWCGKEELWSRDCVEFDIVAFNNDRLLSNIVIVGGKGISMAIGVMERKTG